MEKPVKIFLLCPSVLKHDDGCLYAFEENDIVIPMEAIVEINRYTGSQSVTGENVREILRTIEALPSEKIYDGGATLGEGLGRLRVFMDETKKEEEVKIVSSGKMIPDDSYVRKIEKLCPERDTDFRMLCATYYLSEIEKIKGNGCEVILVTKNDGLRIKAKALRLKAENYKKDSTVNPSSYFCDTRVVKISDSEASELFEKSEIPLIGENNFYTNEYTLLEHSNKTSTPAVFKDNKILMLPEPKIKLMGVSPKNLEQRFAFNALLDKNITLVAMSGKAGTGKTLLAIAAAFHLLQEKVYSHIYITRELVDASEHGIGFIPGTIEEKVLPYMQGIYTKIDFLKKISDKNGNFIKNNEDKLTIQPIIYLRGQDFSDCIFIVDESQNNTPKQVKTIVTRTGEGTKMIFTGDVFQIDEPHLDIFSNGLTYLISRIRGEDSVFAHVNLIKGERSYLAELASNLL